MADTNLTDFQQKFKNKMLAESAEARRQDMERFGTDSEEDYEDFQKDRFLTFKCGGEFYGLSLQYVVEIIGIPHYTEVPDTPDYLIGLINLRGKVLPVIDVRIRFKKDPVPYNDRTCVIVSQIEDTAIGLIVDNIGEVVMIRQEDILDPPRNQGKAGRFIFGIGKFGDDVKLLLDPVKLIFDETEDEGE